MTTPFPIDLPDYLVWANERTLGALRSTADATAGNIFAHLIGAERVWANRLLSRPQDCPIWPDWGLDECEQHIPENAALYRTVVETLPADQVIAFVNSQGTPLMSPVEPILLHVFAHGAYHRGQIAQDIRQAGGEFLDTDYYIFTQARA